MGACGEDCITQGRYRTSTNNQSHRSKAAESRVANTRMEVGFLASAYYDCAQFVFNSGFSDIKIVNGQFNNMLNNYINAGKIKKESYNKFMELSVGVNIMKYRKDDYIRAIEMAFEQSSALSDKFKGGGNKVRTEFKELLKSLGLNISAEKEQIMYLQFIYDVAEATGNTGIKALADKQKSEMGFDYIDFKGPQMRISDGDGCGHGIIHGNALAYFDKVNK